MGNAVRDDRLARDPRLEGAIWVDAGMSMLTANAIAFGLCPLVAALVLGPYALLRGRDAIWNVAEGRFSLPLPGLELLIPLFFGAIVVHEGLHGLGFLLFGRVPRSTIHFGIKWLTLTPYCHCGELMSTSAYRIAVGLPAIVLGLIPSALGILVGDARLASWGMLMLAAAGGDLAILWAVRAVPGRALVRDHPSRAGCQVLVE